MNVGIGIDTGGTYTDAVAYDFDRQEILGAAKALTTRGDLAQGILRALDALPAASVRQARVIALSTTLATNACVEDRGGRARLIFLGGNRTVIDRYGAEYGLPPARDMYVQDSHTTFSGGSDGRMDWDAFRRAVAAGFDNLDGVGIVEDNAVRNSAAVEKQARDVFLQLHDLPVVCGHELFNELNVLQRAASTLLNARLVPVVRAFLTAIRAALRQRGVEAPMVIVRSDGGLMSEAYAHTRPVETLLSGPAASVLGSARLTGEENCVVVDMGGTTTDIALVERGLPVRAVDGVRVGRWKTFVSGLFVRTFGLGGDSAIHYTDADIRLEPYRVTPLCVAAARHPRVKETLRALAAGGVRHSRFLHEHYLLVRDIADSPRYSDQEKAFCAALRQGPLSLREAAQAVPGWDLYNLHAGRLVADGAVQVCGLTPTDIMHIRGDFTAYDVEAARLAAAYVAANTGMTVPGLCARVYDAVIQSMYTHIVRALLEHQDPQCARHGVGPETERLISRCYDCARSGRELPLRIDLSTRYALTGVGAPIRVFLPEVARLLGTRAVTPPHHEVANALGAVVGHVVATESVDIRPILEIDNANAYRVYGGGETREFREKADAEAFAVEQARGAAYAEAVRRGAQGEITVTSEVTDHRAQARDSVVYLGARAVAQAVGTIARTPR